MSFIYHYIVFYRCTDAIDGRICKIQGNLILHLDYGICIRQPAVYASSLVPSLWILCINFCIRKGYISTWVDE